VAIPSRVDATLKSLIGKSLSRPWLSPFHRILEFYAPHRCHPTAVKGESRKRNPAERASPPSNLTTVNCAASQSTVLTTSFSRTKNNNPAIILIQAQSRGERTLSLALTTLPVPRRFTVSRTLNRCKLRQICLRRTTTFRLSPAQSRRVF
jgi:hypothetical protein